MRYSVLALGLAAGLASYQVAMAQDAPVEVSKLSGQQITLHVYPFLTESEVKTLRFVATNKEALKLFITSKGFSALAVAPDEGFAPGGAPAPSAVAIGDFADAVTASSEAVKGCDAKRKGDQPCVVVLEVGPVS